ncbi:DUF1648 domain-containing protein [Dietzia timorensis]|nr:DUF1648 domain-containing protein [Dietzia timorensis]
MSKYPPRLRGPLRIHVALSVCLVPFLLSLSCFAIAQSWYNQLPDSVAIHFGTGGEPDDWMGKNANYAFDAIFMFGFNALNLGLSYFGLMRGRSGQVTGALLAGAVGLVSPLLLATLYFQLDGAEAHLGGNAFLFGLAGAIVCAGVTALTFPTHATEPEKPSHSDPRRAPRESLRSGEKAAYFGGQSGNPALLGSVAALILGSTILVAFVDWWAVAITLVAGIIAIPLIAYLRVRIDQTAVTWAFGFGLPRGSIALSDIESVEVIDINPMDFGGWGYRLRAGTTGLIVRGGPGIRLNRTSGRSVVISLAEPNEAAETVRQLLART